MSEMNALLERKIFSKVALGCFLLSLPLSVRKVFFIISPDGSGIFNEYTDISLYLSDLALIALVGVVILENKKEILSISWWKNLFHVEQMSVSLIPPLLFLGWSGLSLLWSESEILSLFACIKLFEGYLLYVVILLFIVPRGTIDELHNNCSTWNNREMKNPHEKLFHVEQSGEKKLLDSGIETIVPRGTNRGFRNLIWETCSTWNNWQIIFVVMILLGFFQGILAILQFISQSSLGLVFLKESVFSLSQTGVAKIVIGKGVFIRSYGLFPHPNILGGFLAITMLFTISYPLLYCKRLFHVEQFLFAYRSLLCTQLVGFLLTFSKSAFIGSTLALFYYYYRLFHVEQSKISFDATKNVPRGTMKNIGNLVKQKCSTWNNEKYREFGKAKMFHVEQWYRYFGISIIFGVLIFFLSQVNWYFFFVQPVRERLFINHEFFSVMAQYPWSGIGIGQSVYLMQNFYLERLAMWQLQPVHSLYLLILVEVGIIGLGLFLSAFVVPLGKLFFQNVPRGTWRDRILLSTLSSMVFGIGLVSFADHYFWDIQQGQLLFWLLFGLSVAATRNKVLTK